MIYEKNGQNLNSGTSVYSISPLTKFAKPPSYQIHFLVREHGFRKKKSGQKLNSGRLVSIPHIASNVKQCWPKVMFITQVLMENWIILNTCIYRELKFIYVKINKQNNILQVNVDILKIPPQSFYGNEILSKLADCNSWVSPNRVKTSSFN